MHLISLHDYINLFIIVLRRNVSDITNLYLCCNVLYFANCDQFLSQVCFVRTEIISNGHQRKSNTNSKCRFISDNFFFWKLRQPVVDINNVAICLIVMYLYNVSNRHQRKSNNISILWISFLVNLSNVKTCGHINRRKTKYCLPNTFYGHFEDMHLYYGIPLSIHVSQAWLSQISWKFGGTLTVVEERFLLILDILATCLFHS
jgi:hypothetical protein